MMNKKFEDIGIDDINQLKSNSVQEGKNIEYKSKLPEGNDQEKKEFLADVSSFANTIGGHIIYGVEEDNGTLKDIIGMQIQDVDSEILRLDSMIREGIEPRILTIYN